jgi:hypothetical protein
MTEWAIREVPGIAWQAEHDKFRDHTFRTAMTDWPGAWRNWMRKAAEFAAQKPRPTNGSNAEPAWRTEQRERVAAFAGPAAAKRPASTATIIDMEVPNGAAIRMG